MFGEGARQVWFRLRTIPESRLMPARALAVTFGLLCAVAMVLVNMQLATFTSEVKAPAADCRAIAQPARVRPVSIIFMSHEYNGPKAADRAMLLCHNIELAMGFTTAATSVHLVWNSGRNGSVPQCARRLISRLPSKREHTAALPFTIHSFNENCLLNRWRLAAELHENHRQGNGKGHDVVFFDDDLIMKEVSALALLHGLPPDGPGGGRPIAISGGWLRCLRATSAGIPNTPPKWSYIHIGCTESREQTLWMHILPGISAVTGEAAAAYWHFAKRNKARDPFLS